MNLNFSQLPNRRILDAKKVSTLIKGDKFCRRSFSVLADNFLFFRRYYHSQTCMPLTIAEFENDSENELAADWLEITRTKVKSKNDPVSVLISNLIGQKFFTLDD